MLGLVAGVAVSSALIFLFAKKNRRLRNIALGFVGALVLIISSLLAFQDSSFVKGSEALNRFASIPRDALRNPRFMVWGMAIDGFKERPILGWGQDNFNLVFNKYYDPKMHGQEQWFDRAHNIFFDWLIAGGILGLLGYLSLFLAAFALIWKNEGNSAVGETRFARFKNDIKSYFSGEKAKKAVEASILSGLLVAYFINNVFVFDNLFSYILFFSLLAYLHRIHAGGGVALSGQNEKRTRKMLEEEIPFVVIGVPISVLLIAVIYFVNMRPIYANQALIEGIRPHGNSFTKENLDSFREAIGYETFGSAEAREQLLQSAMQVKDAPVDEKLKQETFDFAKEQILLQIKEAPGDARYNMFAGILLFRYGQNSEAMAHFEEAHKNSLKKQTLDFNLILAYLKMGKIDEAHTLAKEAYESEPSFQEAAKYYAITSMHKGDEQFANDLLAKVYGSELYYDETLINVYAQLKKFDKVIAVLQKKLNGGDDPQLHLRIAAVYFEMGKKTESLAEIQGIINAHPDFKQQGEYYMNQIRAGKKP
jgi:tetratricopeptide (TPR) repeat protein